MIPVEASDGLGDWFRAVPPQVEILPATLEHARAIADDLRRGDIACGLNATDAVLTCMNASRAAWAAVVGDRVICIWGVASPSLVGAQAEIWLLTGRKVEEYAFQFLRHARAFVAEMQQQYPRLEANVDVNYTQALRFARWLGFRWKGEITVNGHRFAHYERAAGEA